VSATRQALPRMRESTHRLLGRLAGSRLRFARVALGGAGLWTVLFAGYGCPWFSNMADQQSVRPLEEQPRPTVAGTIPVGYPTPPAITYEEANKLVNPHPPSEASLAKGQQVFETFCVVCHGPQGKGDGPVVAKFIRPRVLQGGSKGYPDGYILALITNGRGNMPSYNRISAEERWDLINYLRKLQSQP
jgi:mono/diheme cytochrome c family protein